MPMQKKKSENLSYAPRTVSNSIRSVLTLGISTVPHNYLFVLLYQSCNKTLFFKIIERVDFSFPLKNHFIWLYPF